MASVGERVVDRFWQPEYIGENRCYPCTMVNGVIAAVVAIGVGLIDVIAGVAVFVLCLGIIFARGYLIPGTPTLTRRYFPDRVLAWFDKEPLGQTALEHDSNVEEYLLFHEIIEPCDEEDDYCLTPPVDAKLREYIEEYRGAAIDTTHIAEIFAVEPASVRRRNRSRPTVVVDAQLYRWPSETALLGDLALNKALATIHESWYGEPLALRLAVLEALRPFHDRCPDCDGAISIDEDIVESCCRSRDVIRVHCVDCESILFEIDAADIAASKSTQS